MKPAGAAQVVREHAVDVSAVDGCPGRVDADGPTRVGLPIEVPVVESGVHGALPQPTAEHGGRPSQVRHVAQIQVRGNAARARVRTPVVRPALVRRDEGVTAQLRAHHATQPVHEARVAVADQVGCEDDWREAAPEGQRVGALGARHLRQRLVDRSEVAAGPNGHERPREEPNVVVVLLVGEVHPGESVRLVDHRLPRGAGHGQRHEPIAADEDRTHRTRSGRIPGDRHGRGSRSRRTPVPREPPLAQASAGPGVGCGMCSGSCSTAASGPSQIGSGVGTGVGVICGEPSPATWASGDAPGSTTLPPALTRTTRRARATRPGASRERVIRDTRLEEDRGTASRCS